MGLVGKAKRERQHTPFWVPVQKAIFTAGQLEGYTYIYIYIILKTSCFTRVLISILASWVVAGPARTHLLRPTPNIRDPNCHGESLGSSKLMQS